MGHCTSEGRFGDNREYGGGALGIQMWWTSEIWGMGDAWDGRGGVGGAVGDTVWTWIGEAGGEGLRADLRVFSSLTG